MMLPDPITYCLIWGKDYRATGDSNTINSTSFVRSDRTGGAYQITEEALDFVNEKDDSWKALLTTWLINQRAQGDTEPWVTKETVEYIDRQRPLPVHVRAERLLRLLALETAAVAIGREFLILEEDSPTEHAWSESTEWGEVHYLLSYLCERGWLKGRLSPVHTSGGQFQGVVTVDGHNRITQNASQAPATDRLGWPEYMRDDPGASRSLSRGEAGVENTQYEVALSFAGEQREYVERVARALQSRKVVAFYDDFEKVRLWGKDLIEELHEVFERKAALSVMFISKEYVDKVWPQHERRSILSRAVREKSEYVLPVRFDDTLVPGLPGSIKYEEADDHSPEGLAEMIAEKLGVNQTVPTTAITTHETPMVTSVTSEVRDKPKVSRGLDRLNLGERLLERSERFKKEFDHLESHKNAFGIRFTAAPVVDEVGFDDIFRQNTMFLVEGLDMPKTEVFREVTDARSGSKIRQNLDFPSSFPPLAWGPLLRGARAQSDTPFETPTGKYRPLSFNYLELYSDGLIELGFVSTADIEGYLLDPDWPIVMFANLAVWADHIRKQAGAPTVEYALEVEIYNLGNKGRVGTSRYGQANSISEVPNAKFPRYPLNNPDGIAKLLTLFHRDFWHSMRWHHRAVDFTLSVSED